MKIPILDLSPEIQAHWEELNQAIQKVLLSGHFILGPEVAAFEKEVASYLGVRHAIGVNSGTDALVIGLRAMGIGPGDEVITSPFTFFATAEAISSLGATPIFVDIDRDTFNLDARLVESRLGARTKVILPVHLFGQVCEMEPLLALAAKHGLKILEDTCQAMGGEYRGKKAGALGDVGAFSFFPSKNLGAFGDGGLIATNDARIAEQCRMLRAHGSRKKYFNEALGYNSRLDEIQAAILRVRLRHLEAANQGRREAARRYDELFAGVPWITRPGQAGYAKHVYHQYTLRIGEGLRDALQRHLEERGIGTMIYYPFALHQLPPYSRGAERFPEAERAVREVLSVPIGPGISAQTQKEVVDAIRAIPRRAAA